MKYMLQYNCNIFGNNIACYVLCSESTVISMKKFINSVSYTKVIATWKIKLKPKNNVARRTNI